VTEAGGRRANGVGPNRAKARGGGSGERMLRCDGRRGRRSSAGETQRAVCSHGCGRRSPPGMLHARCSRVPAIGQTRDGCFEVSPRRTMLHGGTAGGALTDPDSRRSLWRVMFIMRRYGWKRRNSGCDASAGEGREAGLERGWGRDRGSVWRDRLAQGGSREVRISLPHRRDEE
jgi:hypothetical protein